MELASTFGWERYVGTNGQTLGMKTFAASAQRLDARNPVLPQSADVARLPALELAYYVPAGTPVDVKFRYAPNGRITVTAWLPDKEAAAEMELDRAAGLTEDGIVEWRPLRPDRAMSRSPWQW